MGTCTSKRVYDEKAPAFSLKGFNAQLDQDKTASETQLNRLKNLDLFVLDNSIRETTVGVLRAHTVANKHDIYKEVNKCGFNDMIVESFNNQPRIGEYFIDELNANHVEKSGLYAFSDVWDSVDGGTPCQEVPVGLHKCKQFGINNVVLEMDLNMYKIDYTRFTMDKACELVKSRLNWIRSNLQNSPKIFINLRDWPDCMHRCPERVWQFVSFLSKLSPEERIFGLATEHLGTYTPQQIASWTAVTRKIMDCNGWKSGHFIYHEHEQWGTMHSNVLSALSNGATGIWAGVCSEGAGNGHSDSCTIIMNLVRLGNTKVLQRYNCKYLREAARKVTEIVTDAEPNARMPIYGDRAVDLVFELNDEADGKFDMCDFFGIKPEIRISNMAQPKMIKLKLIDTFGPSEEFTDEIVDAMINKMCKNATAGRKEEYNSIAGLAMLFDQSGGKLTKTMADKMSETNENTFKTDTLINEILEKWNSCKTSELDEHNGLPYYQFYGLFLEPYFPRYQSEETEKALQALDMDENGMIDWPEFKTYLIWAGRQYPRIKTKEELYDKALRYGIIPAMNDETIKQDSLVRRLVRKSV